MYDLVKVNITLSLNKEKSSNTYLSNFNSLLTSYHSYKAYEINPILRHFVKRFYSTTILYKLSRYKGKQIKQLHDKIIFNFETSVSRE